MLRTTLLHFDSEDVEHSYGVFVVSRIVSNIRRLFATGIMRLTENVVEMHTEVLQVKVKVKVKLSLSKP